MDKQVKISVIMGVFNPDGNKNVFRAVESIIQQSFQDWELILYNDGSGEKGSRVIRRAAGMDRRIVYLENHRNNGLAYALNQCIRRSSGEYIARMDDDDISKPERLEKQYTFLEKHPEYQWVGSAAELMDQEGVWGILRMPEIPEKTHFLFNSPYIHPSVMFRREVLIQNQGYCHSREILHCEDYELFMRLHQNGCQGYNIQEPLLRYWEDYHSYKKRTYRRRIREMRLRYTGFRDLGLLRGSTIPYVLKPLLVGAVPPTIHYLINKRSRRRLRNQESQDKRIP